MRQCMYCGNKKPLTEFIRGYGKDGLPLYREKTCNDCAERFKAYCIENYSSEKDFRKSTDTYIHFYNEIRPHMTLAYKTPIHFEELYG